MSLICQAQFLNTVQGKLNSGSKQQWILKYKTNSAWWWRQIWVKISWYQFVKWEVFNSGASFKFRSTSKVFRHLVVSAQPRVSYVDIEQYTHLYLFIHLYFSSFVHSFTYSYFFLIYFTHSYLFRLFIFIYLYLYYFILKYILIQIYLYLFIFIYIYSNSGALPKFSVTLLCQLLPMSKVAA